MKVIERAGGLEIPWADGLTAGKLVREVVRRIEDDRIKAFAGNLAYRGLFAVFAILVLTFSALGIFDAEDLVTKMLDQMSGFIPDPVRASLESQVIKPAAGSSPHHAPNVRGALAIIGALYGLSAMARGVIDAMNAMYDVDEGRPFWKRQIASVLMAAVVLALLMAALVLVAVGPRLEPVLRVLRWPLLLGLVLFAFALTYAYAPSVKERFRTVSHGSVLVLPIWVIFSAGFAFFVERYGSFERSYGSLAGIVVLLLYMFISSLIILVGGEVNQVVAKHTGRDEPEPVE